MFVAATKMKGGMTPDEVKDVRIAWLRVFTVNLGELSAGLLLEYVYDLYNCFHHILHTSTLVPHEATTRKAHILVDQTISTNKVICIILIVIKYLFKQNRGSTVKIKITK